MKRVATSIGLHALLLVGAAATLLPLAWTVAASVSPAGQAFRGGLGLLPHEPTFEHYETLFRRLELARAVGNSAFLAAAVTVVSLLLDSLAGYAFAKLRFVGRDRLFRGLLAALVIPGQVAMLPLFLLLKEMGLVNHYGGVIVPAAAGVFGIFLMRQAALSIPDSLLDAARIDGASELRIYWSIVLPACRPMLVTLAVMTFMGTWNDFLWPLIVLTDDDLHTLPVALANLFGEHVQDPELMMAGSVVTLLPVLVLFLALQRQYLRGLLAGGVKG